MTENKPKFTPGPWRTVTGNLVVRDRAITLTNKSTVPICIASMQEVMQDAREYAANAALIAAAPEMYEALAQASTYLHTLAAVLNTIYQYDSRKEYAKSVLNLAAGMDEKATKIDVLLARARGEAQE